MGKQDRFADKLKRKPTPKDVKWRDLKSYLESQGFEEIQKDGSRVRFVLNSAPDGGDPVRLFFHIPHPSPEVKPRALRAAVDTLKERGVL